MVKLREANGRFMVTIPIDTIKGMGWNKENIDLMVIPNPSSEQIVLKRIE